MISTSFLRVPYASQLVVCKRTQIKYWIAIASIGVNVMSNGQFPTNFAAYNDVTDSLPVRRFSLNFHQQNRFKSTANVIKPICSECNDCQVSNEFSKMLWLNFQNSVKIVGCESSRASSMKCLNCTRQKPKSPQDFSSVVFLFCWHCRKEMYTSYPYVLCVYVCVLIKAFVVPRFWFNGIFMIA